MARHSTTDQTGGVTRVGNKTGETWVGGSYIATYGFDAANRLTTEQDTFSKYTLSYDNANRLTNVDNSGTPNAPRVNLTYGYDQISNRTSITDNSGASLALTYDSDNNLVNEVMSNASVLGLNHPTVTLAYDSANRLTNVIRTVVNKFGNSNTITTTFGYDNADRLTGMTHYIQGGSTLMTLTYGYDSANQLTSYAGPDGSITYGYDQDGQLTGATGAHNETYTLDKEGNRTMTGYVTSVGNRLTSDGTYSYTYDQDGNMLTQTRISDSQLTSYTWDFRNRLTEVLIKTSGGTTVQDDKFTYDVENRRIGKSTLSGGQSWTAYVDANPYADFNSSGSLTFWHLYGVSIDSLLGRVDSSGNAMWYMMDKLGSVRENVDANGNVLDSITYDTFGNILAETHPTCGDRFKYTSREWDSEIGQYFYRARYYGPGIGRFESEDPLGFAGSDTDLYRYVRNSPVGFIDPAGTDSPPGSADAFNFAYDKIIEYFGELTEDLVAKLIVKQWIKSAIMGQDGIGGSATKWPNGEFMENSSILAQKQIKDLEKQEKTWAKEVEAKGYHNPMFNYNWCVSWYVLDYRNNPRSGDVRYVLKAMIDVTAVKDSKVLKKHIETKTFAGKYYIEDVKTTDFYQVKEFRPSKLCK